MGMVGRGPATEAPRSAVWLVIEEPPSTGAVPGLAESIGWIRLSTRSDENVSALPPAGACRSVVTFP